MHNAQIGTLAALVVLCACGGSDGPEAPPPPPAVARITYLDSSALVFAGRTVAIRDLVRAYDAADAELPSSRLALAVPGGWIVRGDSITAPTSETVGALRATARTTGWASADIIGSSDSSVVTSAIDLRLHHWHFSQMCVPRARVEMVDSPINPNRHFYADSMAWDVASDSVVYPGDSGWVRSNDDLVSEILVSGSVRIWSSGQSSDSQPDTTAFAVDHAVSDYPIQIERQAPDTLAIGLLLYTVRQPATADGLLHYRGGNICGESIQHDLVRQDALVLDETLGTP